jgi:hypothetical protein
MGSVCHDTFWFLVALNSFFLRNAEYKVGWIPDARCADIYMCVWCEGFTLGHSWGVYTSGDGWMDGRTNTMLNGMDSRYKHESWYSYQ